MTPGFHFYRPLDSPIEFALLLRFLLPAEDAGAA
jgi:hypothetical protein